MTRLEKIYNQMKIIKDKGVEIISHDILVKFKLTPYGASCVHYMLFVADRYCSELERVYKNDESARLKNIKDPNFGGLIQFTEDVGSFIRNSFHGKDIPVEDRKKYIEDGVAKYASYEDIRQWEIHLYVSFLGILNQANADLQEAITYNNINYFRSYYKDKDRDFVIKNLKKEKIKKKDVDRVVNFLFKIDKN